VTVSFQRAFFGYIFESPQVIGDQVFLKQLLKRVLKESESAVIDKEGGMLVREATPLG
jgi:hypothetical protein